MNIEYFKNIVAKKIAKEREMCNQMCPKCKSKELYCLISGKNKLPILKCNECGNIIYDSNDPIEIAHIVLMDRLNRGDIEKVVDMIDEKKAGCTKDELSKSLNKFMELKPKRND